MINERAVQKLLNTIKREITEREIFFTSGYFLFEYG